MGIFRFMLIQRPELKCVIHCALASERYGSTCRVEFILYERTNAFSCARV